MPQPAFRTQAAPGAVLSRCSTVPWLLRIYGRKVPSWVASCRLSDNSTLSCAADSLRLLAAAFQLALSRRPESVAVKLNATNTNTATTILKIRCITRMLKPEADGARRFFCNVEFRCPWRFELTT